MPWREPIVVGLRTDDEQPAAVREVLAGSGAVVVEAPGADVPCVVATSHDGAVTSILQVLGDARRSFPGAPVVLVADRVRAATYRRLIRAGLAGLVVPDTIGDALVATVAAVLAGQLVLPRRPVHPALERPLSVREKEVLGLVVLGLSNRAMAEQLFLSESTVKSHLASAFAKLGVRSRNEAAELLADPDAGLGLGVLTILPDER